MSFGSWDFTLVPPTARFISGAANDQIINAAYAGQAASGASITPLFTGSGGAGTINLLTIAFKSNTTTASNFLGVGVEKYNSGSASAVSPANPSNTITGSTLIASVYQGTSSGTVGIGDGTYSAANVTYGATTLINTDAHTAVTFGGTTGTVLMGMPALLATTSQTLEVWFKFAGTPHGALIFTGNDTAGWGVGIGTGDWSTAGTTLLGLRSSIAWVTFSGIPTLVAGTTYHVVAQNSGAGFFVWLNGTKYTGSSSGSNTPAANISVGSEGAVAARYIVATEQKAAFYTNLITTGQIANHYLAGTTAPSGYAGAGVTGGATYDAVIENDSPLIYWNLGESSGPTAFGLGIFKDSAWTLKTSATDPSSAARLDTYSRIATSSEPASWTFGFSTSPAKSSGQIVAFTNDRHTSDLKRNTRC